MIRLPRKRRTRTHIIADLSANHVELQALRRAMPSNESRTITALIWNSSPSPGRASLKRGSSCCS